MRTLRWCDEAGDYLEQPDPTKVRLTPREPYGQCGELAPAAEKGWNGLSCFLRPITLASSCMTSGVAFVFPGHLDSKLLERWRELGPWLPLQEAAGRDHFD